jgi:hypothetical protein
MLNSIQKIIKEGQFTGCNITLKPNAYNTLSAVLNFMLPPNLNGKDIAENANASINGQLDNLFTLRAALVTPLAITDAGNGLEDAIMNALSNVSESFIAGSNTLSAVDLSALVDQSVSKVATPAKAKPVLPVKAAVSSTPSENADQRHPISAPVVTDEAAEEVQEIQHSWDSDIDSL